MQKLDKSHPVAQAERDLDLAITAIDARATGFVRDGMCFNKV